MLMDEFNESGRKADCMDFMLRKIESGIKQSNGVIIRREQKNLIRLLSGTRSFLKDNKV